jgi:predicted RNase H-like HicB family nuclease
MTLKYVVHEAEDGGYWAEVPALPGCATQADTLVELADRVREAVTGWLGIEEAELPPGDIYEIAV